MTDRYGDKLEIGESGSWFYECIECGSLVFDKEGHDGFHERLGQLTSSVKSAKNLASQANLATRRIK